MAGSVRAQGRRGPPSDDATLADWNKYWESRFASVEERIGWVQDDLAKADMEIRKLISEEAGERAQADAQIQSRLLRAIGGKEGSGLTKTWWGLASTLLGMLLQGLASLFG
jgi:hypothetical protein